MLLLLFFNCYFALTCYQGTRIGPQDICNTTGNDLCITALLSTPTFPDSGTEIYTCGNCSYFQTTPGYFSNVSCCSTDLCQVFGPAPSPGTCDSINNETSCINRTDCYWCENSLVDVGICKNLSVLPCFATDLYMPPPICGSISCTPFTPPYTVNTLTLNYLTNFGLPAITYPVDDVIALDILSREVRILSNNVTYEFCTLDREFIEWCGINSSNFPIFFQYCVVSEKWPQEDIFGWIQNTTFSTNQGLQTIFPAVCACLNPGRAYYVPTGFLFAQAYFSPICHNEHALLAFYILLMLLTGIALIYVISDLTFFIILTCNAKRKVSGAKTFWIKIFLIIYYLLALTDQGLWIAPRYSGVQDVIVGLFRSLGIIFFQFALAFSIFTFCQMILETNILKKQSGIACTNFLTIFKWIILGSSTLVLLATTAMVGAIAWYSQQVSSTSVSNVGVYANYSVILISLAKAALFLLLGSVFIIILSSGILLTYTIIYIWKLIGSINDKKRIRTLLSRALFLVVAFFSAFIWLGFISVFIYMQVYVFAKSIPNPFISEYQGKLGVQWVVWGMFLTELLSTFFVTLAMRTKIKRTFLSRFLTSLGTSRSETTDATSESQEISFNTTNTTVG